MPIYIALSEFNRLRFELICMKCAHMSNMSKKVTYLARIVKYSACVVISLAVLDVVSQIAYEKSALEISPILQKHAEFHIRSPFPATRLVANVLNIHKVCRFIYDLNEMHVIKVCPKCTKYVQKRRRNFSN